MCLQRALRGFPSLLGQPWPARSCSGCLRPSRLPALHPSARQMLSCDPRPCVWPAPPPSVQFPVTFSRRPPEHLLKGSLTPRSFLIVAPCVVPLLRLSGLCFVCVTCLADNCCLLHQTVSRSRLRRGRAHSAPRPAHSVQWMRWGQVSVPRSSWMMHREGRANA